MNMPLKFLAEYKTELNCDGFFLSLHQVFDTSNFIDSLYTWSAFNTDGVGKIVGGAIAELSKVVDVEGFHLIGKLATALKYSFKSISKLPQILNHQNHIFL